MIPKDRPWQNSYEFVPALITGSPFEPKLWADELLASYRSSLQSQVVTMSNPLRKGVVWIRGAYPRT